MSAASCLLRWRTSPALATLFRNRNHQTGSFVSSFSARSNAHWGFATSEVQRFSPASLFLAQESPGRLQQFVAATPGYASVTPPPSPDPDNPSGSSSGKLMKHLGMAAATAAATAVAIYFIDGAAFQDFVNGFSKVPDGLLFGNKTRQPDHQSKLVEPAGNSQPIREPEIDPQFIQETGGDSNVTQVTDSKLRKGDEIAGLHQEIQQTGVNPKDLREAIVILQLSQEIPSKPKVMDNENFKPEKTLDKSTKVRELEDADRKPEKMQKYVDVQVIDQTDGKSQELQESGSGIIRFEESETRSESAEEILRRPEPEFVEETTKTPWIVKETQEMPLPPITVIQKTIIEETSEGKAIVTTLFEVLEIDESVSSHGNDVMVTESATVIEIGQQDVVYSSQRAPEGMEEISEESMTEYQEV